METQHVPVLLAEAIAHLNCKPNGIYLDATLGSGSHAYTILKDNPEIKWLVALDCDGDAIKRARSRLEPFSHKTFIFQANFITLRAILKQLAIEEVDGILIDLGVSSQQLENPHRGFSFRLKGPLDMRMDKRLSSTAFDVVNTYESSQLAHLLRTYGEERWSTRIARAIARERKKAPIADTVHLSTIVTAAIPPAHRPRKIHPATKTFQALRIVVNNELENLTHVIHEGIDLLAHRGRLCIISFHSMEDRIVKQHFRKSTTRYTYPDGVRAPGRLEEGTRVAEKV
jgi:16S rRNA (cytosine1402-N4)-methyltransferase